MANFISSEQVPNHNFLPGHDLDLGYPCSFHLKAYVGGVLATGRHPAVILWCSDKALLV